MFPKDCPVVKC